MKDKNCYTCGNFSRLYEKGLSGFIKTPYGYCLSSSQVIKPNSECAHWVDGEDKIKLRKKHSLRALEDILERVTEIKEILQEEE